DRRVDNLEFSIDRRIGTERTAYARIAKRGRHIFQFLEDCYRHHISHALIRRIDFRLNLNETTMPHALERRQRPLVQVWTAGFEWLPQSRRHSRRCLDMAVVPV